jgi:lycopene cyclase CruA
MLSEIQQTHPRVYEHFSKIQHGEFWLNRIIELDRYWSMIGNRPAPQVIFDGASLPKDVEISGEFDAIYAGATLGLLHAAALTDLFGKRVLLIDKYTPAKTHRDWNISLRELQRLDSMGFLKQSPKPKKPSQKPTKPASLSSPLAKRKSVFSSTTSWTVRLTLTSSCNLL